MLRRGRGGSLQAQGRSCETPSCQERSRSLDGAHGLERAHGWMETHKQTIKKEETILRRWVRT